NSATKTCRQSSLRESNELRTSRKSHCESFSGTRTDLNGSTCSNEGPTSGPNPPYPLEEFMPLPNPPKSEPPQRPIGFTAEVHNSAGTPPPQTPIAPAAPNPPYPVEGLSGTPSRCLRMPEPLNAQTANTQLPNAQPLSAQTLNPTNPQNTADPPSYNDI
uniref:Uncharacterized protein n=1 Tax=Lutzomyia longipalpis TaxID=7200 RepID=A0A1B0CQY3_LUTLO